MAWPYDARLTDYATGLPVESSDLNEMQDAIIDIYADHTRVFWPTAMENQTTSADDMSWTPASSILPWFACLDADRDLWIPISLPAGAYIKEVNVKVYVGSATGLTAYYEYVDTNFGSSATAPTRNLVTSQAASGTPPFWETIQFASRNDAVTSELLYMVRIGDADVGDRCAGAVVTYAEYYAT